LKRLLGFAVLLSLLLGGCAGKIAQCPKENAWIIIETPLGPGLVPLQEGFFDNEENWLDEGELDQLRQQFGL